MAPQGQTLQQRYGRHQAEVASLLRVAMGAETLGFNTLVLADWDGAASLQVLTSEGRSTRHPLQPGQQALVSVAMAKVLGHAALGSARASGPWPSTSMRPNGIAGDRLASWRAALSSAEPFLDVSNGARRLVIDWEDRPWIVILREDGSAVVTTYPSDERTVTAGSSPGPRRWPVDLSQ